MRAKVTSIEQGQDSIVAATIRTRIAPPSLEPYPKGKIVVYGTATLANGQLAVRVGNITLSYGQVVFISLEIPD